MRRSRPANNSLHPKATPGGMGSRSTSQDSSDSALNRRDEQAPFILPISESLMEDDENGEREQGSSYSALSVAKENVPAQDTALKAVQDVAMKAAFETEITDDVITVESSGKYRREGRNEGSEQHVAHDAAETGEAASGISGGEEAIQPKYAASGGVPELTTKKKKKRTEMAPEQCVEMSEAVYAPTESLPRKRAPRLQVDPEQKLADKAVQAMSGTPRKIDRAADDDASLHGDVSEEGGVQSSKCISAISGNDEVGQMDGAADYAKEDPIGKPKRARCVATTEEEDAGKDAAQIDESAARSRRPKRKINAENADDESDVMDVARTLDKSEEDIMDEEMNTRRPPSTAGTANLNRQATATQSQTQHDDGIAFDGDDSAYFRLILTRAGLLLEESHSLGGFLMSSAFSSSSSAVACIRSSVRGVERTRSFLLGLDTFLSDESTFVRALLPIRVSSSFPSSSTLATSSTATFSAEPSLIRVFLKVDSLQAHVVRTLLEVFLSPALEDNAEEDVPRRILQSLCWLDFVCEPDALAEHLLQCLHALNETKNRWLRDAVQTLPEILPDSEHARAVERLMQMLRETRDSAAPLIDALSDLTIPADQSADLVETVLDVLRSAPVGDVPVVIKFLLVACAQASPATQASTLADMRTRLCYLNRRRNADDSSNEALVLKEFHHGLLVHRALCQTFLDSFKSDRGDEPCIDIWLLVALSRSTSHAQAARDTLKKIVLKPGGERVIENAIIGHRGALEGFLDELLHFAASLLQISMQAKGSETLRMLASKLYKWMFEEMADARSRQDIVHALVSHCGAGEMGREEVDSALRCLRSIVRTDTGATALAPFSSYVRSLLNDLDRFDPPQARSLFRVVARVSLVDGEGVDELKILLRKLLMSPENERQCLGIIGTVQLVACLSPPTADEDDSEPSPIASHHVQSSSKKKRKRAPTDTQMDDDEGVPVRKSDVRESIALIDNMLRETRHVSTFDELARMVERRAFDKRVVSGLKETVQTAFEEWFLYQSDGRSQFGNSLHEKTWFGIDEEHGQDGYHSVSVQILGVLSQAHAEPRVKDRLIAMCPMMRCLLATSFVVGFNPDALASCSLTLPNESSLDALDTSPTVVREAVCASFFHACNWIREVVSSFSVNDKVLAIGTPPIICARFNSLVEADRVLVRAVTQVPEFVPPVGESGHFGHTSSAGARRRSSKISAAGKGKPNRATTSTTSKKKQSSTALLNGDDDGGDSAEESSSEDDSQKSISVKKIAKAAAPPSPESSEGEEEAEEVPAGDQDKGFKKPESKQQTAAAAVARALACLRELSPNVVHLLAVPGLRLTFGELRTIGVTAETSPDMHISALKTLLDSCVRHLSCRLVESSGVGGFKKKSVSISPNGSQRAYEFEPDELIELVTVYCLPTMSVFMERICKRIVNEGEEEDDAPLTHSDTTDGIACIESTVAILSKIILYEPLRRSHEGLAQLLQTVRAFSPALATSTTNKFGTFSEDAPLPTDARPMIAEAVTEMFKRFLKLSSDTGVLSNSFGSQIIVVQFLRDLVAVHGEMCDSQHDRVLLRDSLSKLAKTLLKRQRDGPTAASQLKFGKQNLGMLVEVFHDYSSKPLVAVRYTIDELSALTSASAYDAEAAIERAFPLLTAKNMGVFFSATLSSLAKLKVDEDEEEDMCHIMKLAEAFSECMSFTKLEAASKPNLLRDAIRFGKAFLETFVKKRMPVLSQRLKRDQRGVMDLLGIVQKGTRQLNNLCAHGKFKKDASILALTPGLRKALESLIISTKAMLKANNCNDGFIIGNLRAKNLDGSTAKPEAVEVDDE